MLSPSLEGNGWIHHSVPGSFPLHTDWHAAVKLRCLVVLLCRGDPGVHAQCLQPLNRPCLNVGSQAGLQGKADAAATPSPNTVSDCSGPAEMAKASAPWLHCSLSMALGCQQPLHGRPALHRTGGLPVPAMGRAAGDPPVWRGRPRGEAAAGRRLVVLAQHVSLTSLSTCDGCACVWCLSGTHPPQAPIHPSALLVGDSFFIRRFPKSILCPLSKPVASLPGWIWPGAAQSWTRAELPFPQMIPPCRLSEGPKV